MMSENIKMNSEAMTHAKKILMEQKPLYKGKMPVLRLYLEGKGCDGFYYGICVDEKEESDICLFQDSEQLVNIVVDPDTLPFVGGSSISWADDDRGRGFIVENPNHKKFRGKFYKRKKWQEFFEEKSKNI